ncbi:MAG: peptidylprolyl isomerase [Pirellulales bacterium]
MSRTETSFDVSRTDCHSHWKRHWKRSLSWLLVAVAILGVSILIRTGQGDHPATAARGQAKDTPSPSKASQAKASLPRVGHPQHDVMALVNGRDISRRDLIDACVRRHGKDVLESLVNKRLIMNHCEKREIKISRDEINAEVERMASRFKLGREQWLEMLEKERGLSAEEYARDVVWPTLALRKLAVGQLEPSEEELRKLYESQFGPMVRARLISVTDEKLAQQLYQQLVEQPNRFARLAMDHSQDVNSASVGGLIQPIRRHLGFPEIENAAFQLKPGEISKVIHAGSQYVILKCEAQIPPRNLPIEQVREQLVEKISEQQLHKVAHTLFGKLQKTATIQNVYNDTRLRETMPGVVATVNGDRITMRELGKECMLRHGEEVLEIEISQMLLQQALDVAGQTVTDDDLEAEVRHAAELAGVVDQQDRADLEQWFKTVLAEQQISRKQYLRDSVWPSAALKKLTASSIVVDKVDIDKGFAANYGERVRCLAIVLGEMRRAQEVWNKARKNPTPEYFGDLAEQYSIEPTSKSLRGEVPPIQRFGGQKRLEQVAFGLQPGQLSGIVQMGDKYIILRCEGRTERIEIDQEEVREILGKDIYEKKLRMAMSEKFESIREQSRVDNYLAGTSHGAAPSDAQTQVRRDTAVRQAAGVR